MTEFDVSLLLTKPTKEVLTELLKENGEKLRKLKADCVATPWQENDEILELVWKLLALKKFDPELGAVPNEHRGPFTMKIRWRLDPFDQASIRFQNIFSNKIYLTGKEVAEAIQNYMKKPSTQKKHNAKGGFVKIELIEKSSTSDKKKPNVYRTLTTNSIVRMPLQFPGPWLASTGVLEFRVHWPGKPYHMTTPNVYKDQLPEIIDAGVNLFSKEFSATNYLNLIIKRAFAAGVSQMLLISVDYKTSLHSISLAKKYAGALFAIAGVHPMHALEHPLTPESEKELRALVKSERKNIVAIGECGIDYEKAKEDTLPAMKEAQDKWLRVQLDIAAQEKLPVFVHQRGGHEHCIGILKEHLAKYPNTTIIVNCFSGTLEELQSFLKLSQNSSSSSSGTTGGIYFVITGLICSDDRGAHLRDLLKHIPLDRLLLGSDAPHLTPFNMSRPYPRRNEPAFLPHVLIQISEALGLSFLEVAKKTTENSRRAFGIPAALYDGSLAGVSRDIIFSEFQKDEDTRFKIAGAGKKEKAKPKKLTLTADQHVFVITQDSKKIGFIVTTKENAIMQKQEKVKSVAELVDLAAVMELQKVEPNTNVTKEGSEDIVFTTVEPEQKE